MNRLFLLLLLAVCAAPAAAQTVTTLSSGTLRVGEGVIDLHGGTLNLDPGGTLDEDEALGGRVTGGTLTATRTLTAPGGVDVGGLGATITSTADLGATTVTRGHTPQTGDGNTGIERYYDITPTNNTGLDATLVFRYHVDELNGNTEANLVLFRSADGVTNWVMQGGTVNPADTTITLTGIEAFSRWTAASSTTPLPVELVAFTATLDGADVLLQWQTASETNNAGFEIQRKGGGDAETWGVAGFVAGRGTTAEAQQYTYRAEALAPGTHRFRLKQVDFDGAFAYGPEVEAHVELPGDFLLSGVYPNPFNPRAAFTLAVRQTQHVTVALYDLLGRRVALLHDGLLDAGTSHRFEIDGASLASGSYLVRARGDRFTAARTVTLMK